MCGGNYKGVAQFVSIYTLFHETGKQIGGGIGYYTDCNYF